MLYFTVLHRTSPHRPGLFVVNEKLAHLFIPSLTHRFHSLSGGELVLAAQAHVGKLSTKKNLSKKKLRHVGVYFVLQH